MRSCWCSQHADITQCLLLSWADLAGREDKHTVLSPCSLQEALSIASSHSAFIPAPCAS